MDDIIAIIGVGYVGLQNAIAIAKAGLKVIAYDTNKNRINDLSRGIDRNYAETDLINPNLIYTYDTALLTEANYYLISIPTPINEHMVPDIFPLKAASKLVAKVLKVNDVVVLESTVFPGATRDILIPVLEQYSKLESGTDFYVGYSPERIVPGDSSHNASNMTKVISGQNNKALEKIKKLYEQVFTLNVHCSPSMEVAESSKLLENIQRDVNIALMNEFSQIINKLGISFYDVLEAAKTKWNFLPFTPGLVGGHCIPEDPYYLIYQANKLGALPNLVSCARQTNEQFFHFIVDATVKLLTQQGFSLKDAKVVVMGISFKPNVTDTRHSLSIVLYKALKDIGFDVVACDPMVNNANRDLDWVNWNELKECQAMIICQAHSKFLEISPEHFSEKIVPNGVIIDIPGAFNQKDAFRTDINYWSL